MQLGLRDCVHKRGRAMDNRLTLAKPELKVKENSFSRRIYYLCVCTIVICSSPRGIMNSVPVRWCVCACTCVIDVYSDTLESRPAF